MTGGTDPLSPDNVLGLAASALRRDDDQPTLTNPYEAVALVGHACMAAVGFRLVGLGEGHTLGLQRQIHQDTVRVANFHVFPIAGPSESLLLPAEWNSNDVYAFRYAHSQSSMQYLLKTSRIGNNALVFALALGDDRTTSFDIPVKDYISESSLPLSSTVDLSSALREVFISTSRLGDLISLFKINVIQKLAPGLYKEGYEDTSRGLNERQQQERPPRYDPLRDDSQPPPARPYPFDDPLAAGPRRPAPPGDFAPPGFEDEFEIHRPPRGWPPGLGGGTLGGYGNRDLYPPGLGPNDPLRGGVGPGLGGGGGGGMHPTVDDLFGGRRDGGYDPQAPPGSRYDPVGPGGPPFGRGGGPFGRGSGGGFGGFGGDII